MHRPHKSHLCFSLAVVIAFASSFLIAEDADWPQWRGPNRDGYAASQQLLQEWPADGPTLCWSADNLGIGYSSVSTVGERGFTMGTKDGKSIVICLSLADGKPIWEKEIGRAGGEMDYNIGWGAGQRSTPTVDGGQVFALSDVGTVAALDAENGDITWSVELVEDFGGKIPTWGYSESLLIDGDRVIATPGEANFLVGLDRSTGEQVWGSQGVSAPAQYVSVMKHEFDSKTFYVTASKTGLLAFDVETGEKLFEDSATGNKTAVIPTPILTGDRVYHTSAYGAGNTLLQLVSASEGVDVKSLYALNTKSMENHHGGVVLVDDTLYGFTKVSGGNWMAQDLKTGKTLWMERGRPNRSGSISYADERLYCYNAKEGTVVLVEPSRERWQPKGVVKLPRPNRDRTRSRSNLGSSCDRVWKTDRARSRPNVRVRHRPQITAYREPRESGPKRVTADRLASIRSQAAT